MKMRVKSRRHIPGTDPAGVLQWFWRCPACYLASAAHPGCHEANNAAVFHAGGCEWLRFGVRRRCLTRRRNPLTKLDGMVA